MGHLNYSALCSLTIAPDLALEFLGMFSRFEFALKAATFRQQGGGEVKADWAAFAQSIAGSFNPNRTPDSAAASAYFAAEPLRYLVERNGALAWVPFVPRGNSDAERTISIIRQIRNNLFHGGKFAPDNRASADRDTRLVNAAMVLLSEMLSLVPDVEAAYLR